MSATSVAPRITRLALLAVAAATVLSVAACGTSNNQNAGKPTSSARATSSAPPSPPSAPPARIDHVEGMISSVSGDTINLKLRQGTATVDFTPSTKITEVSSAQLSDVTTGSCVKVEPGQASDGGAPTAQSVLITPAVDGKCPPPPESAPGPAGAAPSPPSSAPAGNPGVNGKVDSVSGNTITVATTEANGNTTHTDVTVTDLTTYTKQLPADANAITQGKCMSAEGADNDSGVLQATTIELQSCPPLGGPRRRLPHIPLPHHHHH